MDDKIELTIKLDVEIDEDGKVSMICPERKSELKVAFENIEQVDLGTDLTLKDPITCPTCSSKLSQVLPSEEMTQKMLDYSN